MKYSIWKIPYSRPRALRDLTESGCTPLLAALLSQRSLTDPQEVNRFLYGGMELLEDPFLLPDMQPAVERLVRAMENKETVAVFGDYDVDGITAGCLLTEYLRSRGLACELYIPDRLEEGYGLNPSAVEALHERGVTLIVTVDCGVTAMEETALASSLGIDMIITDHHECREFLPGAVAVIDPKRTDGDYPGRDLAGVGVAFKLVCALDGDYEFVLRSYCDLVSVGTVADVMPLTGENRFLIKRGLQQIAAGRCRPGIAVLMEEAGLTGKRLSAATLGYSLAPRINAAGRLGHADTAAQLLMSRDPCEAGELARELCRRNRERQELELVIWTQAMDALADQMPTAPIVLADEGWHQGVIGIAASRLAEAFSLPVVMICLDGDLGKGSCRSIGGFNLYEALTACSDCLEGFGGHAMAAGLTIRRDRVDELRRRLCDYYESHRPDYTASLDIDLAIDDPALLSMDCVQSIELLEPCGNGNPKPLMYIGAAVLESVVPMCSGKHLRLKCRKFGYSYDCVYFSQTAEALGAVPGQLVDLVFTPQVNEFRSRCSVQLVLTDLRVHNSGELCRRLLLGGEVPAGEAADYLPDRSDFAGLWRRLESTGGKYLGTLQDLPENLGREAERTCICLAVMAEMDLARVKLLGDELHVDLKPFTCKVDLEKSDLLQRLRGI